MVKLVYVTLCIKEIGTDTLGQHFLYPFFATEPSKVKVFHHALEIEAWGLVFPSSFFPPFFHVYLCVAYVCVLLQGGGPLVYVGLCVDMQVKAQGWFKNLQ